MVTWNQGCKGKNQVVGIAAAYGLRAMISDTAGCSMITVNPVQPNPQGGTEILFSVWGDRPRANFNLILSGGSNFGRISRVLEKVNNC
ncbi:MAG: hypothetical protein GDA43_25190 [Hormoscilla sp. SP5CHS1]|nr:hypothetical protein [Hormoscilla sp. SP12CHS1]MBC6456066.1 hypothetical protein [Hormoscilla sp. SP5CHS1]